MSAHGLELARRRMAEGGVPDLAIATFARLYGELEAGRTGVIREAEIEPLTDIARAADLDPTEDEIHEALSRTVVIKLNGGLGTSMGMDRAKSLLPVRGDLTFLDVIACQVLAVRERYGVDVPLVLMNSFRTQEDSLATLAKYPELAVDGVPADFLQNREPKLDADTLEPVSWPADPSLEWCPPGHGDIYTALQTSGLLQALLAKGYRYASVSNSDNLGAAPDGRIAAWFAATDAPYAAELAAKTDADVKGGQLVRRRADGQIIQRETAQTAPEELDTANDRHVHPFFHTNNLWFDLEALSALLAEHDGVMPLPLIRNDKTVDPTDPSSTQVIQLETAMGAAVNVFPGSRVVEVPRARFLPVKATNDLLVLRSDVYELTDDFQLVARVPAPLVKLDGHYKLIAGFEERLPAGPPSLVDSTSLTVTGDWTFSADVTAVGDAVLAADDDAPHVVPEGATITAAGLD